MWKAVEFLFNYYFLSLFDESKRLIKIHSWVFIIEALKTLRIFFIFLLFIIFITLTFTVSLMSSLYYLIYLYINFGYFKMDLFLGSNLIILAITYFILKFYNSEKRWLKILNFNEDLNLLLASNGFQKKTSESTSALSKTDIKNLKEMMDHSLDSKLKEVLLNYSYQNQNKQDASP